MNLNLPLFVLILLSVGSVNYSQSVSVPNGRISGTVFDHVGAVVPDVKVVLQGVASKTEVVTNGVGMYHASLLPGRYEITTKSAGFCPTLRAPFQITPGSDVLMNLALSVCPIGLVSIHDAKGNLIGLEDRYLNPFETDKYGTSQGEKMPHELVVRFGIRQIEEGVVRYSGPKTGSGQLEISYDLMTISADKASLNLNTLILAAEGNTVISDGKKLRRCGAIELNYRNPDPISTLKGC
jgi:hypothetical protein